MASPNLQPAAAPRSPTAQTATRLTEIVAPVADDLARVNAAIETHLRSDIALIRQIGAYIIAGGGKRLRPLTLLLSARAFDYRGDAHVALGAVLEFIHTATLLHDDVVDESDLRRGQDTANNVWGNAASVLVGDFLYSRSFQLMVATGSMEVMDIMADTTNCIAEGEVMQLLNSHSPDVSEDQYLDTIRRKTARLFEAAAELGAVITGQKPATRRRLAAYGLHLGIAFQLVDDALDYSADSEGFGKNLGDDLAEGKPTLPLIHAMNTGTRTQRRVIRDCLEAGDRGRIHDVLAIVESTRSLAYTSARAGDESGKAIAALDGLPLSSCKRSLENLAEFAVARAY